MRKDVACILLAGGSGSRMAGDQPKQFVRIAGKTILEHSLGALRQHLPLVRIVVTAPFADVDKVARMFKHDPLVQVIAGGVSRQASTLKGLKALADDAALAKGLNTHAGKVMHPAVAAAFGMELGSL